MRKTVAAGIAVLGLAVAIPQVAYSAERTEKDATYTLAQIAAHDTALDCWSAVSGGVYNLTGWVAKHPGGSSVITGMCGVDGTAAFLSAHSASSSSSSDDDDDRSLSSDKDDSDDDADDRDDDSERATSPTTSSDESSDDELRRRLRRRLRRELGRLR